MPPSSEPSSDSGSLRITLKDVYIQQTDMANNIGQMKGSLNLMALTVGNNKTAVDDHESRIRGLERWRYAIPTSFILAIFSAAATILATVIR